MLSDRLQKIKAMDETYCLKKNAYISFSGGKDSTVLSKLVDLALPGNEIPRVYLDTGIDYRAVREFVIEFAENDARVRVVKPAKDIRKTLCEDGYPFKSKEHSQKLALFQRSGMTKTVRDYLGLGTKRTFLCPKRLQGQFREGYALKVSDMCCSRLKKEPADKWAESNGKTVTITGVRKGEGGLRRSMQGCAVFRDKEGKDLKKFHPLFPVSDEWVDEFVKAYGVRLCELYYPPFDFKRTGCSGCPFNPDLERDLEVLERLLPCEKKKAEAVWRPVYEEYRRLGYRLSGQRELGDLDEDKNEERRTAGKD